MNKNTQYNPELPVCGCCQTQEHLKLQEDHYECTKCQRMVGSYIDTPIISKILTRTEFDQILWTNAIGETNIDLTDAEVYQE